MSKAYFRAICIAAVLVRADMPALAQDSQAQPEAATGYTAKTLVTAKRHMVVTANPYAAEAGKKILAGGGSAIDAAIATQMVLNLVEPQSSGIGGGAFIVHWDRKGQTLTTYDGRETAPQAAKADRFFAGGVPMGFRKASSGGLAVGVPGLLAVLKLAHERHGQLAWRTLFEPAIKISKDGFRVSRRLNMLLRRAGADTFGPVARDYFFDSQGRAWPQGHLLKNAAFAKTLRAISGKGAVAFYEGPIAAAIARKVQNSSLRAGDLTLEDMRSYQAKERPPVCISYRRYRVCGMGPPSSGGIAVTQTLKLIEPFELSKTPMNLRAVHVIGEAQKLAYADRKRYVADPDFVSIPGGMLNEGYLARRSMLIAPDRSMGKAVAGKPPNTRRTFGEDGTKENSGTSHMSIIDGNGNGVAMTSTIESAFGANIMVGGFLLNNELTDFSRRPVDKKGRAIANRIEPGKRPRSSMAPTAVFDEKGRLVMLTGSPGGSRIILYVVKSLIAHLDWALNAQAAAAMPNFGSRNGPYEIEKNGAPKGLASGLEGLGHKVHALRMTSGSHIIIRTPDGLLHGGADPRREGIVAGE